MMKRTFDQVTFKTNLEREMKKDLMNLFCRVDVHNMKQAIDLLNQEIVLGINDRFRSYTLKDLEEFCNRENIKEIDYD